jgi:hypothetical protein
MLFFYALSVIAECRSKMAHNEKGLAFLRGIWKTFAGTEAKLLFNCSNILFS